MRPLICPLAASLTLFLTSVAGAQSRASSSTQAPDAGTHFDRGATFYSEGDYGAALIEFKRAYELSPHWQVLFNIGQSYFQLRDYANALVTLQRFANEGGDRIDRDDRATIDNELPDLANRVARVTVSSNLAGATISVDDQVVGVEPVARAGARWRWQPPHRRHVRGAKRSGDTRRRRRPRHAHRAARIPGARAPCPAPARRAGHRAAGAVVAQPSPGLPGPHRGRRCSGRRFDFRRHGDAGEGEPRPRLHGERGLPDERTGGHQLSLSRRHDLHCGLRRRSRGRGRERGPLARPSALVDGRTGVSVRIDDRHRARPRVARGELLNVLPRSKAGMRGRIIFWVATAAAAASGCSNILDSSRYHAVADVASDSGPAADGSATSFGDDAGDDAHCGVDPTVECYACTPTTTDQFLNACTTAACVPFDDTARLANLLPDGALPPLPSGGAGDGG